jgi:methylated-DNA-[protein]-cysteine S-methyltransferase
MSARDGWTSVDTVLGPVTLVGGAGGLRGVHFAGGAPSLHRSERDDAALADAAAQVTAYLAGERRAFDLTLDLRGTALEMRVWRELARIPYGATVSYGALAATVGRPDVVRAVAGAVARTPTPLVLPCHRVVGSDGSLRGYVGGLERKAALLALERVADAAPVRPGLV